MQTWTMQTCKDALEAVLILLQIAALLRPEALRPARRLLRRAAR